MARAYKYVFASKTHAPIHSLKQLRNWDSVLGFFLLDGRGTGRELGSGELRWANRKHKYVHTEAVGLNDFERRKGHGIHLYFALIRAAKEIGAKRIYSAQNLNRFSGNMWCNKLREFFDVKEPKSKKGVQTQMPWLSPPIRQILHRLGQTGAQGHSAVELDMPTN